MSYEPTRRDVIGGAAVAGLAYWSGRAQADPAPEQKLKVACIGVGGKGDSDTNDLAVNNEVLALCDVDRGRLDAKSKLFPGAKLFTDYRAMLDQVKGLDAVTISTPDHHHGPAAVRAMLQGISVFVQKPMAHTVYEARLMRVLAKQMGVCSQMGNQGTSSGGLREGVEVIQSGAIGGVTELHVWTNRPVWPQGMARPEGEDPVPAELDWESFIGPAPMRPYKGGIYHPFRWRGFYDFGCGALGDMACHTLNLPFWAAKLGYPTAVEKVDSSDIPEDTFPSWSILRYHFPARGDMPPCTMTWYDGGKKPPAELFPEGIVPDTGSLLIGTKGSMVSSGDYGGRYSLFPEADFAGYQAPEPTIPRSPGHMQEFVQAVKANDPSLALSNFDYAGLLTEVVVLGNLCLHTDKKIEWDGEMMTPVNAPELRPLVHKAYRAGWELGASLPESESPTPERPRTRR